MAKEFPAHMVPLGAADFQFGCHPGVECFTRCCRNVNLTLYPYDVIRLKNSLNIVSEEFLRLYTYLERGDNPYFPTVKLKLREDEGKACPFLREDGCSVYIDRPSACRTYPLERAVDRSDSSKIPQEYYFMTDHPYCLGHKEKTKFSVKGWLRNQQIYEYNVVNDYWAGVDTLFAANPWKGEGDAGERQRLAFLVCYNIDTFRQFVVANNILAQFALEKDQRRRINGDDCELLKFGFEWLKLVLTGKSSLLRK
jgi:Fe-S-cluster containining protein